MPPAQNTPLIGSESQATRLLPTRTTHSSLPESHVGIGPWIGTFIIIVLLLFGGLYFWGAYLNRQNSVEQLPFIPADNSTQQSP